MAIPEALLLILEFSPAPPYAETSFLPNSPHSCPTGTYLANPARFFRKPSTLQESGTVTEKKRAENGLALVGGEGERERNGNHHCSTISLRICLKPRLVAGK
ncbi:hypothetical protein HOY82DRAFT_559839 [Tuber indicum]|nr:hypothetical protein HOY82DRAFT_559839 [Tuber indicum]